MQIRISGSDGVPVYLQIVNQVKYLVASGRMQPGEELLPIRTLAEKLLINPNTVARAYRELETAGVVQTRRGSGCYIAEGGLPLVRREKLRILGERADSLLAEAHQLDVSLEDLVKLLHERSQAMYRNRKES